MEVTKRVMNIMKDAELQKKLASINIDEEFNHRVLKEVLKRFQDMKECLQQKWDPNLEITPTWLNWTFNSISREKCLREAWKAMAIYMALSFEGCENIRCFLAFFDKAKGGKIVPHFPSRTKVMEVQCSSVYNTRTTERERLWSGNLRSKRVGCLIEVFRPT
jgi:hypothetical protein